MDLRFHEFIWGRIRRIPRIFSRRLGLGAGSADSPEGNLFPHRLRLCQYHHQLELMVWGIRTFFERYPLFAAGHRETISLGKAQSGPAAGWQEALAPIPDDPRLYFSLPDDLEFWLNRLTAASKRNAPPRP